MVFQDLMIWVDALRLCVVLAIIVKIVELPEALIYNRESRFASPRGRAVAWIFICLGGLIGAGIPFALNMLSVSLIVDSAYAEVIVATWACVYAGFAVLTADRAKRPAWIIFAYSALVPVAWAASAMKHGAL